MKRSYFLRLSGTILAATSTMPKIWTWENDDLAELSKHKIDHYEIVELDYQWPRFVGKNGRIDFHGQRHKCTALKLFTNQGAMGWGLSNKSVEELLPKLMNKMVSELITPGSGIKQGLDRRVDFALHDLMGIIMDQPVYKLIGNKGTKETSVYSGMIYLDELNPDNKVKGLEAVYENCVWDYNYGYRQLKVKVGRSGRWYPHQQGLETDIEVVNHIHDLFSAKDLGILVDANDMYSLADSITFLDGISGVPLYWLEEPFVEELEAGRKLKKWMLSNGFENTYYADGERQPKFDVCLELGKERLMDVFLPDTYGHGFSEWIHLMPQLQKINMQASPHAWGNRLKTNYTVHLAAGLGNVCTIEGVTCSSDDIDYGNYPIIEGKIKVSDAPGFGMRLLKK